MEVESWLLLDIAEAELLDMEEAALVVDMVDTPAAVDDGSDGASCGLWFGWGRGC